MEVDRMILSGIEFYAFGGVSDAEKEIGQRYRVHVELTLDLSSPAETDDIRSAVDYGKVFASVVSTARGKTFNLIESLAGRIADRLLSQYPVESVRVRVEKLLPPIDGVVASAGVEVTRDRTEQGTE